MTLPLPSRTILATSVLLLVAGTEAQQASSNVSSAAAACDDSKCRTVNSAATPYDGNPVYWWLPPPPDDFVGGYACWAAAGAAAPANNGTESEEFPCADGYEGRPVHTEEAAGDGGTVQPQRYTCCPPGYPEEEERDIAEVAEPECSDSQCDPSASGCWAAPDGLVPKRCYDAEGEYLFPRDTGAVLPMEHNGREYNLTQFLCCKTPQQHGQEAEVAEGDTDADLLQDACSVEVCTSLADDCWADGVTEPFTCDTKDTDNQFIHPTISGHDDRNSFNFHYVCCKTEGYYLDSQKWAGPRIALAVQSAIAFVTSVVTIIFTCALLANKRVRSQGWNLYLVLLSIPDAFYNVFRFCYGMVVLSHANTSLQTTFPIDWFYAVANLLLNAVIVYQVHSFLRSFRRPIRVQPPSIKRVLLQSFVVYVLAALCGVWMYFLHVKGDVISGFDALRWRQIHTISLCCMVIPPIVFVAAICFDVWYRKLLPPSNERTRSLALYFLRVIFVFGATWLPFLIITACGKNSSRFFGYVGYGLSSLQGTLSVLVASTKSDVHWAVRSFLSCKCNAPPPVGEKRKSKGSVRVSGILAGPDMMAHMDQITEQSDSTSVRVSAILSRPEIDKQMADMDISAEQSDSTMTKLTRINEKNQENGGSSPA